MAGKNKKSDQSDENNKPIAKEDLADHLAKSGTLEANMLSEVLSSRRNAWRITGVAFVIGIGGLLVAGLTVYRYAQPLPAQLITINPQTHIAEPTQIMRSKVSYGDAIDKGYLAQYVRARESYDYFQQQLNFDVTRLMSNGTVFQPFLELYAGKNGLAEQWGDTRVIHVEITSILLHSDSTAVVRYTTQMQHRDRSIPEPTKHHIATVSYAYPDRIMQAEDRYLDPLGFLVTSWDSQIEAIGG